MKGLLVKDFRLLKVQKSSLIYFLVLVAGFAFIYDNASFVIGFFTFILTLFSLNSISYDEFDNGNAFLFSLPITRKTYVVEKYYFSLVLGSISWIFSTILVIIAESFKGMDLLEETLMSALMIIPFMLITISMMFPFQFKFGREKAKIAMAGAAGIMFVVGIVIVKIAEFFHVDLISIIDNLPILSMGMMIFLLIVISSVILLISVKISILIVEKKEF